MVHDFIVTDIVLFPVLPLTGSRERAEVAGLHTLGAGKKGRTWLMPRHGSAANPWYRAMPATPSTNDGWDDGNTI